MKERQEEIENPTDDGNGDEELVIPDENNVGGYNGDNGVWATDGPDDTGN